jgi:hypothetical protein
MHYFTACLLICTSNNFLNYIQKTLQKHHYTKNYPVCCTFGIPHKNFIFRHNSKKFKANSAVLRSTDHLYFYLHFNIQHFSFSWKNEMYSYTKFCRVRLGQQVIKKCQISSHCDSSFTVINIFVLHYLLLFCIRIAC